MKIIEHTLLYLRESLANCMENELAQTMYNKIKKRNYSNEAAFVKDLDDQETAYLDSILEKEIDYAKSAYDNNRMNQLKEVYE